MLNFGLKRMHQTQEGIKTETIYRGREANTTDDNDTDHTRGWIGGAGRHLSSDETATMLVHRKKHRNNYQKQKDNHRAEHEFSLKQFRTKLSYGLVGGTGHVLDSQQLKVMHTPRHIHAFQQTTVTVRVMVLTFCRLASSESPWRWSSSNVTLPVQRRTRK